MNCNINWREGDDTQYQEVDTTRLFEDKKTNEVDASIANLMEKNNALKRSQEFEKEITNSISIVM